MVCITAVLAIPSYRTRSEDAFKVIRYRMTGESYWHYPVYQTGSPECAKACQESSSINKSSCISTCVEVDDCGQPLSLFQAELDYDAEMDAESRDEVRAKGACGDAQHL